MLLSETKVDPSFPSYQFAIEGFGVPFRLDRNSLGGGIMLFVREEIPSKLIGQYKLNSSIENIFIEINLELKKWLLRCSYNPNLILLNNYIQNISRGLDFYSSQYDNFIVFGDIIAILPNLSKIYERCLQTKMKSTLTLFFLNSNLDLERDIVHINVYLL